MAANQHRCLTSYVAVPRRVNHPDRPASGQACRIGKGVGVSLVDEQFGYAPGGSRPYPGFEVNLPANPIALGRYTDGETPVSLQLNEWKLPVYAIAAATVGDPDFYVDVAEGPIGDVNYHLVIGGAGNADALAGTISEPMAAGATKKDAVVMIVLIRTSTGPLTVPKPKLPRLPSQQERYQNGKRTRSDGRSSRGKAQPQL